MIPPAFVEIREPVFEGEFLEFEENGHGPGEDVVSVDHRFDHPANEMTEHEEVDGAGKIGEFGVWVFWRVEPAVDGEVSFFVDDILETGVEDVDIFLEH